MTKARAFSRIVENAILDRWVAEEPVHKIIYALRQVHGVQADRAKVHNCVASARRRGDTRAIFRGAWKDHAAT